MNGEQFWKDPIGDQGEDRIIPIARLNIDYDYQRPPGSNFYVASIAKNWNWNLVGRLSVVDRNGSLYVVDGQQRLLAARMRGDIETLPCVVRKSTGKKFEALLFRDINTGGKKPSLVQSYTSGLCGGDPFCTEIHNFIKGRGYCITKYDTTNGIRCIGTIEKLYRRKKDTLFAALDLCMTIACQNFSISEDLLRGAYVLLANGKHLDETAINHLRAAGENGIKREMQTQKAANGTNGGKSQALAILKIANLKRQQKNRVEL